MDAHILLGMDRARKELEDEAKRMIASSILDDSPKPVFVAADFGQGKDLRSLMLIDKGTGKVVSYDKTAVISINENMKMEVHKNDFSYTPPSAEWNAKLNFTHKQARQFRKLRREVGLHKPRIPRKRKKKFKAFMRMTMLCWPDSVFSQVCDYSNY